MPSVLESRKVSPPELKDNIIIRRAAAMERGYSNLRPAFDTGHSLITAENPKTMSRLKMLEPKTFPTAIPLASLMAAVMLTAASGRDVPNATIVRPMIKDGILKYLAIAELPDTKKSAPLTRHTKPIRSKNKE